MRIIDIKLYFLIQVTGNPYLSKLYRETIYKRQKHTLNLHNLVTLKNTIAFKKMTSEDKKEIK